MRSIESFDGIIIFNERALILKKILLLSIGLVLIASLSGCTNIVKISPDSGPAGTPVWIDSEGLWGDPGDCTVKWDGKAITEIYAGSFTVPAASVPGKHKVTLVDNIDPCEAFMIFPLVRLRQSSATFIVTE